MTRQILLSCLLGAALFAGCTDDVDVADNDTATGSGAGSPGSSSSSNGPASGGGGAASSSGVSNGGAGLGGGSGSFPECLGSDDCKLVNDCCACEGVPVGQQVDACPENCEVPSCEALGHPGTEAVCVARACVAGFDCSSDVECATPPPVCEAGLVPSRSHGCWGPCVPATECISVESCGDCDLGTQVCVQYAQLAVTFHCVPKPDVCSGPADCACAEEIFCDGRTDTCIDVGPNELTCECADC